MGSATTAARKVVSSSTLIGPFKILARAGAGAPAQIQTGSQGCVARDKNLTGCQGNASACVIGNSSEAGRGLSPVVSFCLVVRELC